MGALLAVPSTTLLPRRRYSAGTVRFRAPFGRQVQRRKSVDSGQFLNRRSWVRIPPGSLGCRGSQQRTRTRPDECITFAERSPPLGVLMSACPAHQDAARAWLVYVRDVPVARVTLAGD